MGKGRVSAGLVWGSESAVKQCLDLKGAYRTLTVGCAAHSDAAVYT